MNLFKWLCFFKHKPNYYYGFRPVEMLDTKKSLMTHVYKCARCGELFGSLNPIVMNKKKINPGDFMGFL